MYTLHQLISVCKHEAGVSTTRDLQLYVRKDSLLEERGRGVEWRGGTEGGGVRAVLLSVVHRPTHCLFLRAFHKVLNLSA